MKRIRLVLLTGSLNIGGTERNVLNLASALDRRKYHVEVWCAYRGHPLEQEVRNLGVTCRTFKQPSLGLGSWTRLLRHNLPFQWSLWITLRRVRPDVLHIFGFPIAYYGVLMGRLAAVRRIVFTIQDWDVWKGRSRVYRWLDEVCCRLSSVVVADGRGACELAVRRQAMQPRKMRVIYDGVRVEELVPDRSRSEVLSALQLDPRRPVACVVGRLDLRKKGQDIFVRAIPLVAKQAPGMQFLIVGGGPDQDKLRRLADRFAPGRSLVLAGFRSDLADILNAIDVLVIPSRWESVPKVMLEAMWCRVPVVAARVGDIGEILDEGCGVLIPPDSPRALAEALVRLQRDGLRRSRIARNGRRRIESRGLTLQTSIGRYDKMYRELTPRSG